MNYLSIELRKTKRRGIWLVLAAFLLVFGAWMYYCVDDDQFLDFGWMMNLYNAPLINTILLPTDIAVCAVQCFISLVMRSFAIPIGIALIGGFAGLIATSQGLFYAIPYSLFSIGMRANNPNLPLEVIPFTLSSIAFIVTFYLLSVWYLRHHDVRTQE